MPIWSTGEASRRNANSRAGEARTARDRRARAAALEGARAGRAADAPLPPLRSAAADRGDRRGTRRPAAPVPLAPAGACGSPLRRPRTHRRRMVAPPRQWRADARLLPRRGYPGSPLLALSPRALRRKARPALVYPRGTPMNDTPETCPETGFAQLVAATKDRKSAV